MKRTIRLLVLAASVAAATVAILPGLLGDCVTATGRRRASASQRI